MSNILLRKVIIQISNSIILNTFIRCSVQMNDAIFPF